MAAADPSRSIWLTNAAEKRARLAVRVCPAPLN